MTLLGSSRTADAVPCPAAFATVALEHSACLREEFYSAAERPELSPYLVIAITDSLDAQ